MKWLAVAAPAAILVLAASAVVEPVAPKEPGEKKAMNMPSLVDSQPKPAKIASPVTAIQMAIAEPFSLTAGQRFRLGSEFMDNKFPEAAAIADVTGDGRDDVLVVTSFFYFDPMGPRLYLLKQDGAGQLESPVSFPYSEGLYENANNFPEASIVVADFNHDGTKDVAVGYGKGIAAFIAQGNGAFSMRSYLIAPEYRNISPVFDHFFVRHLVTLDIDRDGWLDIVALNGVEGATIFFGASDGSFFQSQSLQIPGLTDAKAGDVTGDGYDDLVVLTGNRPSPTFRIFPNIGERGLGSPITHDIGVDDTFVAVATGDFNEDGWNEIVVATRANKPYSRLFRYSRGLQRGYSLDAVTPTGDLVNAMVVTDLDLDTHHDLLLDHSGWSTIGQYARGDFSYEYRWLTNEDASTSLASRQTIATGDLDSDGCTDVAVSDINYGLWILWGQHCHVPQPAPTVCPSAPAHALF